MKLSNYRSHCLICKNVSKEVFDLGMHPYADTFIPKDMLGLSEPCIPLKLGLCENCGQIQTLYESNSEERYNLYDYSYTSSNSNYSKNYWDEYAEFIKTNFKNKNLKILEIGCNDGYLIKNLLNYNYEVYGIDASEKMVSICKHDGLNVEHGIFGSGHNMCESKAGYFDVVIANNVLNHSNEPLEFVKSISRILNSDGTFIFEQPYWGNTVRSLKLDQVYHEHVSYITAYSALKLVEAANLFLDDAFLTEYHGGSLRSISKISSAEVSDNALKLIEDEKNDGLFTTNFYETLEVKLKNHRNDFLKTFYNLKLNNPNAIFVGVGAAAKANTFLNYYKLDNTLLDFVTDISDHKIGKYTPQTRIEIIHDNELAGFNEVFAIILSWNLPKSLIVNLKKINQNIKVIEL
ncbi:methyltransferase domain-containing protein [Alphaproteobacteria bacterium]|nr:methyltransferase domain-containing protein [Alphaproteobacteria bacterium]